MFPASKDPIADIHALDLRAVPLEWHEAVALVQELAARALAGDETPVPAVDEIKLDAEGQVHVSVAGPRLIARIGAGREAQTVANLRTLLADVLPAGQIPPALRALAQSPADGGPEISTLEEFSRSLAFFERPGRQKDLRVVASRLALVSEQARLQGELAQLTKKTRHEPETASPEPPPIEPVDPNESYERRPVNPRLIVGLVAAGVLMVGVVAIYAFRNPGANVLSAGTAAIASTGRAVVDNVRERAKVLTAPSEEKAAATEPVERGTTAKPSAPVARAAVRPAAPRPPRASASADPSGVPRAALPGRVSIEERNAPATAAPSGTLVPQIVERGWRITPFSTVPPFTINDSTDGHGTGEVYDQANDAVTPARLVRPQLPEIPPGVPLSSLGVFEFVIGARGKVERIRLVSSPPDRQYRDIMLMPAAKAWIFSPAIKDGEPVRYRLQIHIPQ
jgi:hypothetical protein